MSHSILIKNAKLFAPGNPLHKEIVDILTTDGKIMELGVGLMVAANELLDMNGYWVSAGWMDAFGTCPDPGEPWKESIVSYTAAAQKGGFTDVFALCGSSPKADNESVISQVYQAGKNQRATLRPWGLASVGGEGKEMSELMEMKNVGAIAFTDGMHASSSANLRQKLMQYCDSLGLVYSQFPLNKSLSTEGKVHEGVTNLHMGLKGVSSIAETMELAVDIHLATYNQTSLNVLAISCVDSVHMIKEAKANGMPIKAAVPVLNLLAIDEDVVEFDENLKVMPVLRTSADREALRAAVLSGDIDAVISNHTPEDIESKKVEFDYSAWGAATLSWVFPMMLEAFGEESMDQWLQSLTVGNARFVGVKPNEIAIGNDATFTFFSTEEKTIVSKGGKNGTKGWNVPFEGRKLAGKVKGTMIHSCYMEAQ